MSVTILKAGLQTTIQDLGRYGYQKYGVIVSGAMDTYAMRLSNIAVGNDENEGVLEITMLGPSLKISKGNLISITGADFSPSINNKKVPLGRPIYLKEDCVLNFGKCISGCRCYLAVAGGFNVPVFMESKSTYLRAKIGGKDGRALEKGDVLEIGTMSKLSQSIIKELSYSYKEANFAAAKWYLKEAVIYSNDSEVIRVYEDMQFKEAQGQSIEEFFSCSFSVDIKSDRMGYRLNGPKIKFKEKIEMISGEVSFGTIQIPPDGNPIILLADRATAGGYPKLAHVAFCDIQKLVQLKPFNSIKFKRITLKEAEKLYLDRERYIDQLKKNINLRYLVP